MKSGMKKQPSPPTEVRNGPPRPGPAGIGGEAIVIPAAEFHCIIKQLRTNVLLGAAAAEALEAAAGLSQPVSPGGAVAKELRSKVAQTREEDGTETAASSQEEEKPKKPKKKGMMFAAEEPEEIPEVEEAAPEPEEAAEEAAAAEEAPELNLNPKQNKMRTDLEMWVMDEIPVLYGVEDSEELDESLQEDEQATKVTQVIAEASEDKQKKLLTDWLTGDPDAAKKESFLSDFLEKVKAIQDLGGKKKKKKKSAE